MVRVMTNLSFDIYLRATPQEVRSVLTEPAMVPSWLAGLQLQPDGTAEDPRRLTCEWLQTDHLEINGGASSVVRFDLVAMGQVTRLTVSHRGLEPDGSLLKVIMPGWPMILSSLKSLMETGEPLKFRGGA
jgi:Activator of Hsp90 ATPase homolog 1-like protein